MNRSPQERLIALAGVCQASAAVRDLAEHGASSEDLTRPLLDSVFRLDAESTEAVYGDLKQLLPGVRILAEPQGRAGQERLAEILATVSTLLVLGPRFLAASALSAQVAKRISELQDAWTRDGGYDPELRRALGQLYGDTVSTLNPRVLVRGNPQFLQHPAVVIEVRAMLLAGLRSAVLFHQLGGSRWTLVLRRQALAQQAAALVAELELARIGADATDDRTR